MKKQNKKYLGVLALVIVGFFVYFSTNSALFQGKLSPNISGTKAFTLVDSAYLDSDFDGVPFPKDKCPETPAHQLVRFGAKDHTTYLGQTIKLDRVESDLGLTFDVNGKSYGVAQNGSTYVKPNSRTNPGFAIKHLFALHSSDGTTDEAIVVISRTDYNIETGCK